MDFRKEQEYIKQFFASLTEEEFISMLEECGNNRILPSNEIYRNLCKDGFYQESFKYATKSRFQPKPTHIYDQFELNTKWKAVA